MRIRFHPWMVLAYLAATGLCGMMVGSAQTRAASPPNILLILADDMGWGDLGCTGSQVIRTPGIDRLAASGVLCTQAYVTSAVCAPSRAGLITGRDPRRFGFQANLPRWNEATSPDRAEFHGLHPDERTIGDHLRSAGYTTGLIGKWHLGYEPVHHPNRRGFDYFCGMIQGSHTYFPKPGKHSIERNGVPVKEFSSPYLTDFFTDEAMAWMEAHGRQGPDRPWFLFLAGKKPMPDRRLYWRLQGQAAVLDGTDKLIRLSHRPAQWFRPGSDPAEARDLAPSQPGRLQSLFQILAQWEAGLPTRPHFHVEPYWEGVSANHYDTWKSGPEPR